MIVSFRCIFRLLKSFTVFLIVINSLGWVHFERFLGNLFPRIFRNWVNSGKITEFAEKMLTKSFEIKLEGFFMHISAAASQPTFNEINETNLTIIPHFCDTQQVESNFVEFSLEFLINFCNTIFHFHCFEKKVIFSLYKLLSEERVQRLHFMLKFFYFSFYFRELFLSTFKWRTTIRN